MVDALYICVIEANTIIHNLKFKTFRCKADANFNGFRLRMMVDILQSFLKQPVNADFNPFGQLDDFTGCL